VTERQSLARNAREALGLSQREFAALLGVPHATVGRWEAGMRNPGAVGEALFALILDSPRRSGRALRRRKATREVPH
jgi:DNA-binding transcriptional regulator YiaG